MHFKETDNNFFSKHRTRSKYGLNDEMFKCTMSLIFVMCVINMIFAKTILIFSNPKRDTTPLKMYWFNAISYLVAMVTSNMALQHVNYPTQVIGKSCKPIPVMILGVLYGKKKYPLQKYFFIMMIVAGVALFVWKDGKSKGSNDDGGFFGYFLLMFSLAMDGMTGGIQDRMRAESKPTFSQLMYNINLWSSIFLSGAVLLTGEVWTFISFVQRFPFVLTHIFWFSILSAFGQLFIFLTVQDFGPLPLSLVTTTRKFFTVLASIIYFGNPATSRQYMGTVLVFLGLALDTWKGKKAGNKQDVHVNGDKVPLMRVTSKD